MPKVISKGGKNDKNSGIITNDNFGVDLYGWRRRV